MRKLIIKMLVSHKLYEPIFLLEYDINYELIWIEKLSNWIEQLSNWVQWIVKLLNSTITPSTSLLPLVVVKTIIPMHSDESDKWNNISKDLHHLLVLLLSFSSFIKFSAAIMTENVTIKVLHVNFLQIFVYHFR